MPRRFRTPNTHDGTASRPCRLTLGISGAQSTSPATSLAWSMLTRVRCMRLFRHLFDFKLDLLLAHQKTRSAANGEAIFVIKTRHRRHRHSPRGPTAPTSVALLSGLSITRCARTLAFSCRTRGISIQARVKRLLEKHAVAPSAARLCYALTSKHLSWAHTNSSGNLPLARMFDLCETAAKLQT